MSYRLFNIEPIGVGTPYVESLQSYIKRLAEAHSVFPGTLMEQEIYPEIFYYGYREHVLNYYNKNPRGPEYINEIVRVLENKTGNCNIKNLSLLKLGTKIYSKFTFRKYAAWCPLCYEESKLNGVIYEPLIWAIEDISVCAKHNVKLNFRCPNCNYTSRFYGREERIGYCTYCKTWLGSGHTEKINDFSILVHDQISKIISLLPSFDNVNKFDTPSAWNKDANAFEICSNMWEINSALACLKKIKELITLDEERRTGKPTADMFYRPE